jgi:predicted lipid carrier protein YhbT
MLRGVSAQPPANPADAVMQLFDRIRRLGRVEALADVTGSLRFDIDQGGQNDAWLVSVHNGQISVEHRDGEADCVVQLDGELLARMATGQANAMTALLRADMMVTGDVQLLVLLERLLPGPAGAHGPRRTVMSQGAG